MTDQVCLYRSDNSTSEGHEFYNLYLKQIGVDFTFSCAKNKLVKAHKIILMTSSSFFYDKFKTSKGTLNCLLPNFSADSIRLFLELVYTRKVNATSDAISEVMKLADLFCVEYQEIEGGSVGLVNHEIIMDVKNTIMDDAIVSNTVTEMQGNNDVGMNTSGEQDLTLIHETDMSDTSDIIEVSENLFEQINNNDDVTNNSPLSNHNTEQSPAEENYNQYMRTMNFANLSSSCVICMKFYPDMKKHIDKNHEFRKTPKWQCEKCKKNFFWLHRKFHVCN